MNKETLHIARQKRGKIEDEQLVPYSSFFEMQLMELLRSNSPTERTIGATILGQRKVGNSVEGLCKALTQEKALYPKIAICEALKRIGKESVEPLSLLIGVIGNNREAALPEKYFRKKSYPLARDIAVRTIINIGKPAIHKIIELSSTNDKYLCSQIIDALGGLLHKTKDLRILGALIKIFEQNREDEFLLWKTIRAFSAVESKETACLILSCLKHSQPAIRWETVRTLGLTANSEAAFLDEINILAADTNKQVKQAWLDAVNRIKQRDKQRLKIGLEKR